MASGNSIINLLILC